MEENKSAKDKADAFLRELSSTFNNLKKSTKPKVIHVDALVLHTFEKDRETHSCFQRISKQPIHNRDNTPDVPFVQLTPELCDFLQFVFSGNLFKEDC